MKLIPAMNPHIYFNPTDSFRELFNFITKGNRIDLNTWTSKKHPLGSNFIVMKR